VRLFSTAATLQDERDVVHMDRFARVSPLDNGRKVGADVVPDLKQLASQRRRMLAGENLSIRSL
jgi:hypothetical protein